MYPTTAKRLSTSMAGLLLGACLGATGQAWGASIHCAAARDNVEKAICATPALLGADGKLADGFAERLRQCPAARRALLRQTQKFWLRDRNNCANLLSESEAAVRQCVSDRMAERSAQFERIGVSCDLDAVADQYRFVDPGYLLRFAARYEGRQVAVSGSLRLDSCDDPKASRVTGKLRPQPPQGDSFPVRFKAMPDLRREWVCDQNPASHFQGTVRREGPTFYLYLSDLLGEPL
jgi:uncharacterized protein YecT (DUF1311 family)